MKKTFIAVSAGLLISLGAVAQSGKKTPPPPPKPPKAPVEMTIDAPPPPPPPPPPPVEENEAFELPKDYKDFMARNPSISSLRWRKNSVVIAKKDGSKESYATDEKGIKQAEAKYGKLPVAPPPPPPPPPPVAPKAPVPPVPEDDENLS